MYNLLTFIFFTIPVITYANDVSIISMGTGKTFELAQKMALRNALEQTFGSYVSSRTEIFNDELVVDEIVSVASGNVKNFKVIDKSQLPNNYWSVTVDAVVSVDKLTSFAKGKGMEVKVEGALFAANVKQKELNKKAEVKVIYTMFSVINEIFETAWDYSLETGQPSKNIMVGNQALQNKDWWYIPITVTATANENVDFCADYIMKTLRAISLNSNEVSEYTSLGLDYFVIGVKYKGETQKYYLRKTYSVDILGLLGSFLNRYNGRYINNFYLQSNIDKKPRKYRGENMSPSASNCPSNGGGYGYFQRYLKEESYGYLQQKKYGGYPMYSLSLWENKQKIIFKGNDPRKLDEIENITSYNIKTINEKLILSDGGVYIGNLNGKKLIFSLYPADVELERCNRECRDKVMADFNKDQLFHDWRLPTEDEIKFYAASKDCPHFLGNKPFYLLEAFTRNNKWGTPMHYNAIGPSGRLDNEYDADFLPIRLVNLQTTINEIEQTVEEAASASDVADAVQEVESAKADETPNKGVPSGRKAPDLNLPNPYGENISLYSLKGKIVLVNFWASIMSEHTTILRLYNKYKDQGFTVYSVSLDTDATKWRNAIQAGRLNYPFNVSDLKGWSSEAARVYEVGSLPKSFLIGRNGYILEEGSAFEIEEKLKEYFE